MSDPPSSSQVEPWHRRSERGSVLGIRILVGLCRLTGRGFARFLLRIIVVYFVLFARQARRASAQYLRLLGHDSGWLAVYRHVLTFAHCSLDRVFFLAGEFDRFEISREGHDHLVRLVEQGQGALLIGAHLGSFEALRGAALGSDIELYVVGYFDNARMINQVLDDIGPNSNTRFLDVGELGPGVAVEVHRLVRSGKLVAMLADRAVDARTVSANFFGAPAEFPGGPFIIASLAACPVFLTFGMYQAPNHYHLICEPFAERVTLPRKTRSRALSGYAQRYAERLEHYCREAPLNWFNFYDFWSPVDRSDTDG